MTELFLHLRPIKSVFSLLGENENDITYSIGWALSRCDSFLQTFLEAVTHSKVSSNLEAFVISLQEFRRDEGITDIEIRNSNLHVIVEAKRGWALPNQDQLRKYVSRFKQMKAKRCLLVTMSECSDSFAALHLPEEVQGVEVRHIHWKTINNLTKINNLGNAENRLMQELRIYLSTIVNMQPQESNWVYVVSLSYSDWTPRLSFVDVVETKQQYFHPVGTSGWPKEPPNYLGFRYQGKLQSIHHVEHAEVITNFHPFFPERPDQEDDPHFLYSLGPGITPSEVVKTGNIFRAGRRWAMLDLLLTSETIAEASSKSYKRMEEL